MRNRVKTMLLVLAVTASCIQPVNVSAAQETAMVKVEASAKGKAESKNEAQTEAHAAQKEAEAAKKEAEREAKKAAQKAAEKKAEAKAAAEEAVKAAAAAEEAKRAAEEAAKKAEEAAEVIAEEQLQEKRQEIVDFALQFEGNPYVYGGTSLTNGADCSGFVMSVFQEFGYELPRVAAAQKDAAALKPVEDIEVGDLVFYGDYGIDHVALYIGDEKIIHASTSATGIKISDYNYRQPAAVGTYLEK